MHVDVTNVDNTPEFYKPKVYTQIHLYCGGFAIEEKRESNRNPSGA